MRSWGGIPVQYWREPSFSFWREKTPLANAEPKAWRAFVQLPLEPPAPGRSRGTCPGREAREEASWWRQHRRCGNCAMAEAGSCCRRSKATRRGLGGDRWKALAVVVYQRCELRGSQASKRCSSFLSHRFPHGHGIRNQVFGCRLIVQYVSDAVRRAVARLEDNCVCCKKKTRSVPPQRCQVITRWLKPNGVQEGPVWSLSGLARARCTCKMRAGREVRKRELRSRLRELSLRPG